MDSFGATILDLDIEDAKTKMNVVDKRMKSIMCLKKEVELREKAAQKAKQEVDNCSLEILWEIDELKIAQQRAKETNDKCAGEIGSQRAYLAYKMKQLHSRVSNVLNEGYDCLDATDEMYKSLEKRLSLALKQKEAAEKEKIQKETELAYQKSQMEKLVQESNKLEQQARENLKLQEFLVDRIHIVNMLQKEISYTSKHVNSKKQELEDYKKERKMPVTNSCLKPIMREIKPRQDCKLSCDTLKEVVKGGVVSSKEDIYFESQDVKLIKKEFENYQDKRELLVVAEDCSSLTIQDMPQRRQDHESSKCHGILKRVNGRVVSRKEMKEKRMCKSLIETSKKKQLKKWIKGQIKQALADHEDNF